MFAGSGAFDLYTFNNIIEQYYLNPLGLCPVKRLTLSGNSFTDNGDYPDALLASINDYTNLDVNVRGISGAATPALYTDAQTYIFPFTKNWLTKNVYFVWEFTNDMQLEGATAQEAYDHMVTYLQALRVAQPDAYIICATMMPRSTLTTRQNDADLYDDTTLNGKVRNHLVQDGYADAICDTGSDALMGQYLQNTDTTYYNVDAIHPNTVGSQRLVDLYIYPSVSAALA
jgi:hypothetical protein